MAKTNPFLKKATGAAKAPVSVSQTKKHGLGRGLDGLLGGATVKHPAMPQLSAAGTQSAAARPAAPTTGIVELPIMDIERSPYQPRRDFKEEELKELGESIRNNGLVQPPWPS